MSTRIRMAASAVLLSATATAAYAAPATPLSVQSSFRVGTSGVQCSAQLKAIDDRLQGLFDRVYLLTCRDAAAPVGTLLAVRDRSALALTEGRQCEPESSAALEGLGSVRSWKCRDAGASVDYRRYATSRGSTHYVVEGLAGYDPVLRLALASAVNDRVQPGDVRVATTEISDPAAFARIQAGALDPAGARNEAYFRNNGGRYAESAEFFDSIARSEQQNTGPLAEALANAALQQSNLGNAAAAESYFTRAAAAIAVNDGVLLRLLRNYRAIAALNRMQPSGALEQLAITVPPAAELDPTEIRDGLITFPLATEINRNDEDAQRIQAATSELTPAERSAILDAQARALRGTALRLQGQLDKAGDDLGDALRRIQAVRSGRVLSTEWLKADIAIERALVAEARGDQRAAEAGFDNAIAALSSAFPQSPALLSAKARKAAYLARQERREDAATLFSNVVDESAGTNDSGTTLRGLLVPYFALLAGDRDPTATARMFAASQALQRPGVAQTQAVLARQFSQGEDGGGSLFRLSLTRTREIARTEMEVRELEAKTGPTPVDVERLSAARSSLEVLRAEQTSLQSQLAAYPRYKVLSRQRVELGELQAQLRPDEAYWKMAVSGDDLYALLVTPTAARTYRLGLSRAALEREVQALRDSIVRIENGRPVTDPFDLDRSSALYQAALGPVKAELAGVRHLIVEPDGALLQLPLTLLVTDRSGVDRYKARIAQPGADEFDFRGVAWLGRDRQVSTSVGVRSFLDVRSVGASRANRIYLGVGGNAVPKARPLAAYADECDWPLSAWQAPISTAELSLASQLLGADRSTLLTGADFSDTRLLSGAALDDYRIVQFATHGLVTAPRPDCPPRPALVTSFGGEGSDGLLSFREIFDLKLDADLVILSACDTAGLATVAASREAGLTSGGGYALDGLVRAFVGAGARSVIASHWPVPDDYDATRRLMGRIIQSAPGESLAGALAAAERGLMDDPQTSHPFYWAAFTILGDGAKPLLPPRVAEAGGPESAGR